MESITIRERLELYAKEQYKVEPEQLPFNHEDYSIFRHIGNGKWFAVFIVKPRSELGLDGGGDAQKVKNIQWGKIRNIVNYEVLAIYVNEKNNGLFVRVHDKKRLEMSICNHDLSRKIKEALE